MPRSLRAPFALLSCLGIGACDDVTVAPLAVDAVILSPAELALVVGDAVQLEAQVRSSDGASLPDAGVLWSSSDPTSVPVTPDGTVIAVRSGSARITGRLGGVEGVADVTVAAGPALLTDRTSAIFTARLRGQTSGPQSFAVTARGGEPVDLVATRIVHAPGQPTGWLDASLASPATPTTLMLRASAEALPTGIYGATVRVGAPDRPDAEILVSLSVRPEPALIAVAPGDVAFTLDEEGTARTQVEVTNAGGEVLEGLSATLEDATGAAPAWLEATLSATTAPATLTLRADAGALSPGVHRAQVRLDAEGAANSPLRVPVVLTVRPTARERLTGAPVAVDWTWTLGGARPGPTDVTIATAGGAASGGLAVQIQHVAGQPSGWVAAALSTTTTPATLSLRISAPTLSPGAYDAVVQVSSPDAAGGPLLLPVHLDVLPAPSGLYAIPDSVVFRASEGGARPAAQPLRISSTSPVSDLALDLDWGSGPAGWLATSLTSASTPSVLRVEVTRDLPAGDHRAVVRVGNGSGPPLEVPVVLEVAGPPRLALSPSQIHLMAIVGDPAPVSRTVRVLNSGGGGLADLSVRAIHHTQGAAGWLGAVLSQSDDPADLVLTADVSGLAPGRYEAWVLIASTAPAVVNSPRAVRVTLVVEPPPS